MALDMDTTTPFLSDHDIEMQKKAESESTDVDGQQDSVETAPSSSSASILSMPDPLSSSNPTSVQYDTIHLSDYASVLESGSGVPLVSQHDGVPHHQMPPEQGHPDHSSDHEYASDSEAESESSFPSVTSSFFFSSPASVASHGPGDDSHEESNSNEDGGSESSRARGLRVTQEFVIPSLILPEALSLPNPITSVYYPLDTPHASKPRAHDDMCLLIVAPAPVERATDAHSLSEKVKNELDEAVSISQSRTNELEPGFKLCSIVPSGHDVQSVLTSVINSFSENELFSAVVLVSETLDGTSSPDNKVAEALSPFVPIIHLLYTHRDGPPVASTSHNISSFISSAAALTVSSVQELYDLLIERPEVSQRLRAEAVDKYIKWATPGRDGTGTSQLKELTVDRRNRERSRQIEGNEAADTTMLGHIKDETVTSGNRKGNDDGYKVDSEGSWRQFKAQWEASWEDTYSWQGQEHLSREVAVKLRQVGSQSPKGRRERRSSSSALRDPSDEDSLRTAKIPLAAAPAFAVGLASTLKPRRKSFRSSKKPAFKQRKSSSSSSSSPIPATSPSLPASSSLPSTMPSSLSLSESFFISADELPESPFLAPVPLAMAFPFPSSSAISSSLLPPPSRARSRGVSPGSVSPYLHSPSDQGPPRSSSSTPFILNFHAYAHAGQFDPLHLPSFIALSFSILAPLRAHVWSATHRLLTAPFRLGSSGEARAGTAQDDADTHDNENDDDEHEHKQVASRKSGSRIDYFDGDADSDEYESDGQQSSSSSLSSLRRALWPTGLVLVGGFLLGFAVGYIRAL
jgi:hypothetical protein